jgi:hypothetical protein
MKRAGRKVALVTVGETEYSPSSNGLSVYRVPADIKWRELETVSLAGV